MNFHSLKSFETLKDGSLKVWKGVNWIGLFRGLVGGTLEGILGVEIMAFSSGMLKGSSLGSSSILWKPNKTLFTSNSSPSSGGVNTSSILASSSFSSSWVSSSFVAVYSAKVTTFLLTQSDDKCPNPRHLKHRILLRGWDLRAGGGLICGWVDGIEVIWLNSAC